MTPSSFGEVRTDGGRRAVRFERLYDAEIDAVWTAVTEPSRLVGWFAAVSGDLRQGGQVFVDFGDGEHTELVVRRCDAPNLLEVDWSFAEAGNSVVLVELTVVEGGTRLVLDHTSLPDGAGAGYAAGWHAFLDRLADDLSGGDVGDWQQRYEALIGDYREAATPRRERRQGADRGSLLP
jgi:uncharacterized protein YndB with AHSA1/START domain